MEDGQVQLGTYLQAFWLTEFDGSEDRLRLALIQASAYVQPNSSRPLEAQVSSQLARMARDKRERDARYQSAVSKTTKAKPITVADVFAARRRGEALHVKL